MIMQVHDELVFEIKEEILQDFSMEIKQHMENAATLDVPLIVEIGHGNNWDEAH
jgi:DNA polymerase-1